MKKSIAFLFSAALLVPVLNSCSTANDDLGCGVGENKIFTESFENFDKKYMAGPTSKGDNLYADFEDTADLAKFTQLTNHKHLTYGINKDASGVYNFWNGGVAVSNWNTYTQLDGSKDASDWYTDENQCSVYNTSSTSGSQQGAGASGNNFAVVTGTASDFSAVARISFKDIHAGMRFISMKVCNTAYAAGVALNGNAYAASLKETNGYLEMIVTAGKDGKTITDAQGNPVKDTFVLVDYRGKKSLLVERWADFVLKNISQKEVDYIEFSFEGSDMGDFGLNTPAYAAIDDLRYGLVD